MRQRSLKQDKNDWNEFRHHRDRFSGCLANEFMQEMPLVWTAEGASVPLRGIMRGGAAFLVCNGPSFNDLDKRPLNYCYTMALNNGPAACYTRFVPSAWTLVDDPSRFLLSIWLNPQIQKFVPHAHAGKPLWTSLNGKDEPYTIEGRPAVVRDCPNVLYFHRNEKFEASRFWIEDTFNWGMHSDFTDSHGHKGGRSVMLVALKMLFQLGFRRIYIVGADFKMAPDKKYSFDEVREKGAINCNNATYAALNDRLKEALPHAEALGLTIRNCTPDSGLKAFEYLPYEDALKDVFSWCGGDYRNLFNGFERTAGMYVDPKKKLEQWKSKGI